jgi:molybdopterin molybdotransferase
VQAKLKADFKTKPGLTRFLPARVFGSHANPEVELVGWQGSGDIVSVARANCFLVVPPDRERIAAGEQVSVLLR